MENRIPKSGYIGRFSIRNVPIFIHWTFPVGGVFFAFFLGNPTLIRTLPLVAAYTILIIFHELGHAIAAKMYSSKVHCILVTGAGGWCIAEKPKSFSACLLFYAGGVIAQLLLLLATTLYIVTFGSPESKVLGPFVFVFTLVNAVLIIINLIPAGKSDGMRLVAAFRERINP
ncbi:hypothetical protein ACQE3E_13560 [Methylomonas sp. MED-D]|uniref:hypothetical protein n=1 Tax=Methylomonas sp. MED-D TaxID=3418768 RepID=UPI003CFCE1DE